MYARGCFSCKKKKKKKISISRENKGLRCCRCPSTSRKCICRTNVSCWSNWTLTGSNFSRQVWALLKPCCIHSPPGLQNYSAIEPFTDGPATSGPSSNFSLQCQAITPLNSTHHFCRAGCVPMVWRLLCLLFSICLSRNTCWKTGREMAWTLLTQMRTFHHKMRLSSKKYSTSKGLKILSVQSIPWPDQHAGFVPSGVFIDRFVVLLQLEITVGTVEQALLHTKLGIKAKVSVVCLYIFWASAALSCMCRRHCCCCGGPPPGQTPLRAGLPTSPDHVTFIVREAFTLTNVSGLFGFVGKIRMTAMIIQARNKTAGWVWFASAVNSLFCFSKSAVTEIQSCASHRWKPAKVQCFMSCSSWKKICRRWS